LISLHFLAKICSYENTNSAFSFTSSLRHRLSKFRSGVLERFQMSNSENKNRPLTIVMVISVLFLGAGLPLLTNTEGVK
jgi:hypothetical protein